MARTNRSSASRSPERARNAQRVTSSSGLVTSGKVTTPNRNHTAVGNSCTEWSYYWDADCRTRREALSARLDGEAEPAPAAEVDAHARRCADCSTRLVRAQALTRAIRVRLAHPGPDLVAVVPADAPPRHLALAPRLALAAVAIVQLWPALAQLLAGATSPPVHGISGHLFNEGAAWNPALDIGLLVAAVHAHRAAGLLPTLGGFVAVLAAFSAHDLLTGVTTAARVLTHLPVLTGLVLLHLVHRAHRNQPAPGTPAEHGHDVHGHDVHDGPGETGGDRCPARAERRGRGGLRPTAHRRAA
ncbi:zf-HC2 domain-containing protein [Saccharothrix texasensis]|uniref:zf-HC2 domain-containing protein n=1 Tax=Saccharothrix texasensis TaxID=103734 RepID=UPI003CCC7C80